MEKRWIVKLSQEECKQLETLINKGKVAGYKIKHTHILLKAEISFALFFRKLGCI